MRNKLLNLCLTALMMLMGTSAWAIDKVDGVYQIGTVGDLEAFAALVNSGEESNANAVLTADIDCGASQNITIGCDAHRFVGKFDGQGHTITIDTYPKGDGEGNLFRNINPGGEVCNLITAGQIHADKYKYAAGIAAWSNGFIHNCASFIEVYSNIDGDATHAGIVGVADAGAVVNCLSAVKINGATSENCGGIIGWNNTCYVRNNLCVAEMTLRGVAGCGSIMRNPGNTTNKDEGHGHYQQNFFLNVYGNTDCGQQITSEQLSSGEICYRLNAGMEHPQWFQKDGDPYPLPVMTAADAAYTVGASVAANCMVSDLAEDATFTFGGGQASAKHELYQGRCVHCGFLPVEDIPYTVSEKGVKGFAIANADDMIKYSWYRYYCGKPANAYMVADVDMGDAPYVSYPGNNCNGEFDGQGHTLTIHISDAGLEDVEGEWAYTKEPDTSVDPQGYMVQPFKNGANAPFWNLNGRESSIHDLVITGTIESLTSKLASSVTNELHDDGYGKDKPRIYNIYSDVEITSGGEGRGDLTHAGLIGVVHSKNNAIKNVVFAGKLDCGNGGNNCGGLIGWTDSECYITDALMIGELSNIVEGDNDVISRNPGASISLDNVYYLADNVLWTDAKVRAGLKEINEEELSIEDGSLTYRMNGNSSENVSWTQTLGVDGAPIPMPSHGIVYAVPSDGFRCDGKPLGDNSYTNEYHEAVIPDHTFENCFCSVCGKADFDGLKPNEDGVYELATAGELACFSHMVNQVPGMLNASFKLTDDIDMGEEIVVEGEAFTASDLFIPIGFDKPFAGTADGDLHPISHLSINYPDRGVVGFFAHVGTSDKAHPVRIENFILDNTCYIHGKNFVGLIGQSDNLSAGEANKIIMNNIGVECYEISCTEQNAGGVIGCCMNEDAWFEINNCYVTCALIKGGRESSALTGWFGNHATVKSCWTTATVEGVDSNDKYFGRFGSAPTLVDCFTLNGSQSGVGNLKEEDLSSGKLAWDLNGHSFANPAWFQNLDAGDPYPTVKEYQGHVYCLGGEYFSATDEETSGAAAAIVEFEEGVLDELVCQKAIIDYMKEQLACFEDAGSMDELGVFYDNYDRETLQKSVDAYAAYKATIDDVKNKLNNEYSTLSGEAVDELNAYLATAEEDVYEAGELDADQIKAEAAKVYSMLDLAIRTCYGAGSDVTDLMANADFSRSLEGWEWNGVEPSFRRVVNKEDEVCYGGEYWDKYFTMSQTIEGLKPGVYEFSMNAAYRPSDNIYSYNHAAYIFANGIRNYIMTSGEDMLPKGEEVNGVNAYINEFTTDQTYSGTYDFCYFSDPQANKETSDEAFETMALGSITRNPVGMALAAKAGRYLNKVIGVVGEDGKLTVGLCNPGQHTGADGTLFANAKLKYLGTVEEADLTDAYTSMVERATSELTQYNVMDLTDLIADPGVPSYSVELKDALDAAAAEPASIEAAEALSKIFADIYDCKQAYKDVYHMGCVLANIAYVDFKTIPDGVEPLYSEDEVLAIAIRSNEIIDAYYAGDFTMSDIDALYEELKALGLPEQDEDGVYQAGTAKDLVFLAGIVAQYGKADIAMTNDIDVSGVNFPGFGNEQAGKRYTGTFDGQDHKLMNIYVNFPGQQSTGFFNFVGNATVKNVQVDASCEFNGGAYTGFIGSMDGNYTLTMDRVATWATVTCSAQNGGGLIGCCRGDSKEHITNCFVAGTITSANEGGAISGWLATSNQTYVRNSLSIATIVNGDNFYRKGDGPTASNNYSLTGGTGATKVDAEQLASGETTYLLNNSSIDNVNWFQTLGTDATPLLYGSSDIVYYVGGKYVNEEPYMGLNAFAYDVKVKSNADQVEVSYTLNADAKAGKIVFKSAGEVVKEVELSAENVTAGEKIVTIANSDIAEAGTEVTFELQIKSKGVSQSYYVDNITNLWTASGLAVVNCPSSPAFGQLLVSNSVDVASDGGNPANYPGNGKCGVFAFDPQGNLLNEQAYNGGEEIKGIGDYLEDPRHIRVSDDGRIFVSRNTSDVSPIYEINATNMNEWTPVFTGSTIDETSGVRYIGDDVQVGRMISFDAIGTGEDLKLVTHEGDNAFFGGNQAVNTVWGSVFNLGTASQWDKLPSASIPALTGAWTIMMKPVQILSDHNGGFWYVQYRGTPNETLPALKHIAADGVIDYSDASTSIRAGAFAVSKDGKTIAYTTGGAYLSYSGKINVYRVDYKRNAIGEITLTTVGSVASKTDFGYARALAFDYADNLYASCNYSERVDLYVTPSSTNNETVTPSVDTFKIGQDYTGIEDVKVVGPMANGYIYNLAGQRQAKAQRGINIVNGKKILK